MDQICSADNFWDWDCDSVRRLMEAYVNYLSHRTTEHAKKFHHFLRKKCNSADNLIRSYMIQRQKKLSPSQRTYLTVQLVAMDVFLHFLRKKEIISKGKRNELKQEWYSALLPGFFILSSPTVQHNGELANAAEQVCAQNLKSAADESNSNLQHLQHLLSKLLSPEHLSHFPFVPIGESYVFPSDTEIWGCFGWHTPNNKKSQRFKALKIRIEDLEWILNEEKALWIEPPIDEFIQDIKRQIRNKQVDFAYPTDKVRFRLPNRENVYPAFVFMVDKLTFLSEDQIAKINGCFPSNE